MSYLSCMIDKIPQLINEMDWELIHDCLTHIGWEAGSVKDLETLGYEMLHDIYNAANEHKESVFVMAKGLRASAEYSDKVDRLTLDFILQSVSTD